MEHQAVVSVQQLSEAALPLVRLALALPDLTGPAPHPRTRTHAQSPQQQRCQRPQGNSQHDVSLGSDNQADAASPSGRRLPVAPFEPEDGGGFPQQHGLRPGAPSSSGRVSARQLAQLCAVYGAIAAHIFVMAYTDPLQDPSFVMLLLMFT
ncbi:hypothetical protein MNEG_8218, partial [Monoraphidium neglectum]|jgi:hypothetical protein